MTEYIPIYQSSITISHSDPAMEASYGNQTIELSRLQSTELLKIDLGTPVLDGCSLDDFLIFWFAFGSRWFKFHLPEMELNIFTSAGVTRFAYFEYQGLNIYKLYLSVNGRRKRIYLPKNLKIIGFTGVIRQLSDYTFYLSQSPDGLEITGEYDIPVIFSNTSASIDTAKETRLTNIQVDEILIEETVTPPVTIPTTAISNALAGTVVNTTDWQWILTVNNSSFVPTNLPSNIQSLGNSLIDVQFDYNGLPANAATALTSFTHVQVRDTTLAHNVFTANIVIDDISTIYGPNNDSMIYRPQYYRCVAQVGLYYFDIANVFYGVSANAPKNTPYAINIVPTNTPNWVQIGFGTGPRNSGVLQIFNPAFPYFRGWGLLAWANDKKKFTVTTTKTTLV